MERLAKKREEGEVCLVGVTCKYLQFTYKFSGMNWRMETRFEPLNASLIAGRRVCLCPTSAY